MALGQSDRARDPTPLYFRLECILRGAIEIREYGVGQSLPSERELGEQYGVSRITVRRALERLEWEGLVRRGRGRRGGTFVLDKPVRKRDRAPIGSLDRVAERQVSRIKILTFDIRPCDAHAAGILGLPADDGIRFVERIISTSEGPIAYVRNYVRLPVGARVRREELGARFLRDVLAKHHGVEFAKVEDEVEACLAESRVATRLKISAGSPVLRVTRVFVGADGKPACLTILLTGSKYRMALPVADGLIA